ncbi:GDCCVxC domain-containing (seleno)protein [Vibrio coralliilyticus]|uniref:GDCCVxC domain-containing (seleno)protein n=1 Tax=Vibrio coralliilyticus TaxID=190893 RepID=UPI001E2F6751|nr:GDCCVxC domain-containing (seleno)protein [Vibrio coralliilyticus]
MEVVTESKLTCTKCGLSSLESMPDNACVYFYECKSCGELLKPLPGDCCVFCSYGTVPCPPIQISGKCCQ